MTRIIPLMSEDCVYLGQAHVDETGIVRAVITNPEIIKDLGLDKPDVLALAVRVVREDGGTPEA